MHLYCILPAAGQGAALPRTGSAAAVEVTGLGFGFRRLIQIVASRQSGSGRVYVPADFNALTYKHYVPSVALAKP